MSIRQPRRVSCRPAFSLVELITVVLIIALIIAIIVPALGGARDAARRTAAEGLTGDIQTASAAFRRDRADALPGYFTPGLMGSEANGGAGGGGMTAMENLLLDLALPPGAIQTDASIATLPANDQAAFNVRVYPGVAAGNPDAVRVNVGLIGSDSYLRLDGDALVAQTTDDQAQTATADMAAASGVPQMPDVVDPWGQPLLAWVADTARVSTVRTRTDFARRASDTGRALFYWNSNAGYLRAPRFGRKATNMAAAPDYTAKTSLIGVAAADAVAAEEDFADLMATFLGDPAFPSEGSITGAAPYTAPFPLRGRGEIIIHSAGSDGIPFAASSRQSRAAGALSGATPALRYGINFATSAEVRRTQDGRNTSIDFASEFDDLLNASN